MRKLIFAINLTLDGCENRGIRVAFISRDAFVEREEIVEFPVGPALDINNLTATGTVPVTRMGRGALRVRVQHQGGTIDLITTHLKSKLLTFPRPGLHLSMRTNGHRRQVLPS